ncbi:MAG: FMN-binding glutamate synthase family protein [bacterium]
MWDILLFLIYHPIAPFVGVFLIFLFIVGIYDIFIQRKHAIQHNFPVIGHLRYFLELIGPELRQYWVANDKEEQPFNRDQRRWIYSTAKQANSNFGFGSTQNMKQSGYILIKHKALPFPAEKALHPLSDPSAIRCAKVIGEFHQRKKPFRPNSVVNISAMSFGSLGQHAITALNKGAKMAGCYHNTGEGGVSPYHTSGADLVWQLGTAYFGARDQDGNFCLTKLLEKIDTHPQIRCIEIKLSQGAKPGKGGILPAEKITPEIAKIRDIELGKDCYSPNHHTAFDSVDTCIDFIELIAKESGLPVGIKAAIGQIDFFKELAKRMKSRKAGPDYIVIDGAEGGTGAAPLTFTDHVALPFRVAFSRIYTLFQSEGLADRLVWIGSGKLGFPDQAALAFAMGCDAINIAREAMLAVGCIQAQKCHTNHCPVGVATQKKWLQAGLNVYEKAPRFAHYVQGLRKELIMLSHSVGHEHPAEFSGKDIEIAIGDGCYTSLDTLIGYRKMPVHIDAKLFL